MKKSLPLIWLLILFCSVSAAWGTTVDFVADFPDVEGQNNLYALGYNGSSYYELDRLGTKFFGLDSTSDKTPIVDGSNTANPSVPPIYIHPADTAGDAVLAFKAPTTTTYHLIGAYTLVSPSSDGVNFSIFNQDNVVMGPTYVAPLGSVHFDYRLPMQAGNFIYIRVNKHVTYSYDWGSLQGSVTTIPPPSAAFLLLLD